MTTNRLKKVLTDVHVLWEEQGREYRDLEERFQRLQRFTLVVVDENRMLKQALRTLGGVPGGDAEGLTDDRENKEGGLEGHRAEEQGECAES